MVFVCVCMYVFMLLKSVYIFHTCFFHIYITKSIYSPHLILLECNIFVCMCARPGKESKRFSCCKHSLGAAQHIYIHSFMYSIHTKCSNEDGFFSFGCTTVYMIHMQIFTCFRTLHIEKSTRPHIYD